MTHRLMIFLLMISMFFMANLKASVEVYQFEDQAQEQRYKTIINQLRCPKCQNQSIADSDAPLSKDLRDIVQQKIVAGESDKHIFDFMRQRYGDWVLYNPPLQPSNYVLWFLPLIVFLLILIIVIVKVANRKPVLDEDDEELT